MATNLTPELAQALREQPGRPVQAVDPATQQVYFIVPGELYERVRALFDDEDFDIRDTYAAQDAALRKVWDDPELDVYNDYDAHKPQ
jgi:hypothetical protein